MSDDLMCKVPTDVPHCSGGRDLFFPRGMEIKLGDNGAEISNLDYRLQAVFPDVIAVWAQFGYGSPVVTSGNDGIHSSPRSFHYQNLAIDLRGRNIPRATLQLMAVELQKRLGNGYFVQAEFFSDPVRNHIHIQARRG